MRSIERRFKKIELKNPDWSSWTCFTKAIEYQDFSKDRMRRMFNKLVNKNDYEKEEKRELFQYLSTISKPLTVHKNKTNSAKNKQIKLISTHLMTKN